MSKNLCREKKRTGLKKYLFIFLAALLLIPAVGMKTEAATTCKSLMSYPGKTTAKVNMRKKAGTNYKSYGMLEKNAEITILGYVSNKNQTWYKCKGKINGKTKTGYVSAAYIKKDSKPTGVVNKKVTSYLNVRKSAKTSSKSLIKIPKDTKLTITGIKKVSGKYWYKVKVTYKKKTKNGYVLSTYVDVKRNAASGSNPQNPTNNNNNTDASFETLLKNFPESYKASLRALHKEYPNWRFVAVNTNLDWSTVIKNESVVGRNVIQSNYPKGSGSLAPFSYLSTESGAYNWATDTYRVKDGSNWYSANSQVIAYYMDPRNFLNSTDIFQFEALAYDSSHSVTVVQSILSNTFMKGNYSVVDSATKKKVSGSYKQAFMDAGKTAKTNPYFLATRSKQEVGVNGSNATSGKYKGYEGIYNFYNIGAFDGGDAVVKGLQWARTGTDYGKPWTNPYKSIVGGAQFIATKYINEGQNTLYFQKFNVKPNNASNLYLHQYMTNVQAPYSEGRTTRSAYNTMGVLKDTMVFYIPVYKNMPASACKLPASSGNPNAFLSSIKVYNGSKEIKGLTPTFIKPSESGVLADKDKVYTLTVPKSVSKVTLKATAISKRATVSGTGSYNLQAAGKTTTLKLTCKAQNGKTQVYTVKIVRNTK